IIARDRCSRELAEKKLDSQLPIHQKVALADYCISNEGPLEELDRSVPALYATLVTLPPRSHARL
ncbi:MAG: Dephospho-CoA kinase, partial [Pseudomonadota bacterium]